MSVYSGPNTIESGLILYLDADNPLSYSTGVSAPTLSRVDVLVVGGGGGGGGGQIFQGGGGGGGAGGVVYRTGYDLTAFASSISVTIGTGGAGGIGGNTTPVLGTNGGNSIFAGLTALGGGGGGILGTNPNNGGSGGGTSGLSSGGPRLPGQATDPTQGNAGGANGAGTPFRGAGGGGAGAPGDAGGVTGNGGAGVFYGNVFGTSVGAAGFFAGGGGGGIYQVPATGTVGGVGGGGGGTLTAGVNGTANTGGGGGGGGINNNGALTYLSGSGGSGVVIVRYAGNPQATGGTITTSGGFTQHVFTSSGSFDRETWQDLSDQGNTFYMSGSMTYNSAGYFVSTASATNYWSRPDYTTYPTTFITTEMWVQCNVGSNNDGLWSYASTGGDNNNLLYDQSSLKLYGPWGLVDTLIAINDGVWRQVVRVSNRITGQEDLYINGDLVYTTTITPGTRFSPNGTFILGQEQDSVGGGLDPAQALEGNYAVIKIYNRTLSADEIFENFQALRGRFGI